MEPDSYSEKSRGAGALTKHRAMPHAARLESALRRFSPGERLLLYALSAMLAFSALGLLALANAATSVTIPARGGSLTEGLVGPVRFVNPLLALSGPDKDIGALVYSGLMRATPEGKLIPDLAERVEISEDGTVYTFTLRPALTFHDGAPLTSADVLFTIARAQDPEIKSARRADWEGVSAVAPDPRTVVFTLPHAYAPFLENATLGILPKHLWESVSAEEFPFSPLNTRPVGSGPYKVAGFDENATGAVTRYSFSSFDAFALGEAHIEKLHFLFYPNEEALIRAQNAGRVDGVAGISPSRVGDITRSDLRVARAPLPRTFGVFLNQNKNAVLAESSVRAALDSALDKQAIVDEVLKGYGVPLDGPVLPGALGVAAPAKPEALRGAASEPETGRAKRARDILSRGGWTWSDEEGVWKKKALILSFTLATGDEPSLAATAEAVASAWREAGIRVEVHVYPLSELNTVVLRPRNYEAVLFGEVVGRTLDLFAFWHSSQRNDPGLNIALYTNAKADALLAQARATTEKRERDALYERFIEYVADDRPAIFLYAPEFIYVVPERLEGVELGALSGASERFLNVYEWYADTERVWHIFTE